MKKLKVLTVVGTRPEIIRLSCTLIALDNSEAIDHILVHTGQNYDYELNEIFFDDLDIRKPDYFLDAAGSSGSETIGNVIIKVCEGMYYRLVKRGVQDDYLDQFNFKHYGGSLVLGVNAPVIVGHGITKSETFLKMIELAQDAVETQLTSKIQKAMSRFIAAQIETTG